MADDKEFDLTPEEFLEVRKFEKLQDALEYWALNRPPVPYLEWQKVYGKIRKVLAAAHPDDKEKETTPIGQISSQISADWTGIMTRLHGEGFRKELAKRQKERVVKMRGRTRAPGGDGGGTGSSAAPGSSGEPIEGAPAGPQPRLGEPFLVVRPMAQEDVLK